MRAEQRAIDRINIAARQRFLVQQISKSTCFAMSSHNPADNGANAWTALDTFNASFDVLIQGSPDQGLEAEKNAAALAALDASRSNWTTFEAATRQIVSGDWHSVPVAQVLNLNDMVLSDVNKAVDQIIETHTKHLTTRKAFAATVNIAGRQRMLVQKAAKEMCFISLEIEQDSMRADLVQTTDLFEASLNALENGDYDMSVIDPPSLAVLVKISEVRALWKKYRVILDKVTSGDPPNADEVAFIETKSESLYRLSDDLVALYLK